MNRRLVLSVSLIAMTAALGTAHAACDSLATGASSYFLSAQDGRAGNEDGRPVVRDARDTLAVIEVAGDCLRVRQEIEMPTSLVGPPASIAIAPGGRLALISAATQRDPADVGKVVPFDLVSVVALDPKSASPARVLASLHTGAGPSGLAINPAGTLALVPNRAEGTISVLAIDGQEVRVLDKLTLGEDAAPAQAVFTPDGRHALVSRDGDNRISLISIDGQKVMVEERALSAGLRPYSLDISPDGTWAVVGNLGGGQGDADTVSLIDLDAQPPRVVDTVTVGQTPEGVAFAPDGRTVGVTVIDGSNKPAASPFHGPARYRLLRLKEGRLLPIDEITGGQWLQGHAFGPDGRSVLVQDAISRQIRLYHNDEGALSDTDARLTFDGAPSAIEFWR